MHISYSKNGVFQYTQKVCYSKRIYTPLRFHSNMPIYGCTAPLYIHIWSCCHGNTGVYIYTYYSTPLGCTRTVHGPHHDPVAITPASTYVTVQKRALLLYCNLLLIITLSYILPTKHRLHRLICESEGV